MQQLKNSGQSVFPPIGKNTFFSSRNSLVLTQTRQDMSFYPTIVVREPSSFTHTPLAEAAEHGPPLWLTLLPHKCVRRSFTSFHEDDFFLESSDFGTADSYQSTPCDSESWPKQGTPKRIHADGKRSTLLEFFGNHYITGVSLPSKARYSKQSGRTLSNIRKTTSIRVSSFDGLRSRWPAEESHRSDQVSSAYFLQESFVSWTGSTAPLSCLAGRNRAIDAFLDSVYVEELSIELLGRQDAVSPHRRLPPSTSPSCFSLQVQQAHEKTQLLSKHSTDGETDKGKQLTTDVSLPPCIPPRQSLRQAFLLLRHATVQSRERKTGMTSEVRSDPDLTSDTKPSNQNAQQLPCQSNNGGVWRSSPHRGDAKTVQVVTGRTVKAGQPHDNPPSDELERNEKHSAGFPMRSGRHSDEGVYWPPCGDTRKPPLREQQFQTGDPPPMSASTGSFSCRPTDADYERLFYIKIGHGPERVVVIHGICMSGSFFSDILACFGGTLEELKQTGQSGETQAKPSSSLPGCESNSNSSAAATSPLSGDHHQEGLKRRPNKPAKSTGDDEGMRDFPRDATTTKRNQEWKGDATDSHSHQGDRDSGGKRRLGVHQRTTSPATITTASSAKLDASLFTFYIVDLLGFGRSTTIYSETEYSRKEQAQRVIQDVICNEKLSAVHLVGHSFGSLVAAEVAAMLPTGAVKSVLLLSPAYFESTRQAMQSLSSALFPASHSAAHPILAFFILKFGRMLKPVLEPLFSFFVPKDELSSLSVADLFRIDPDAMVGTIRSIVHERLEDSLQTMQDRRIRVTLVHGTGDGVIPIRQAQVMAERYSNVHLRPVKGFVHHFPSSHSKFTAHLIYQEVLRHREATSTRTNMRVQSVASGLGRAAHPADALGCRTALSTGLDCSEFL